MRSKKQVRSLAVGAFLGLGLPLGPGSRPAAAAAAAGEILWSVEVAWAAAVAAPRVASDDLWALTADGAVRWVAHGIAEQNFPIVPTVSPDGRTLVFGTVYGFGRNGSIYGVDATDGSLLWSLPVAGTSAGAVGPAAFGPDGRVVYVPVGEIAGANRLLAIALGTTLFADGFESGSTAAWPLEVSN
jgi:outer membrane protein assembly factor BamB